MKSPADPAVAIRGRAAWRHALQQLMQGARREVCVQSYQLESFAYGHTAFVDAVKKLVIDNRRARVRALINDIRPAARGHRLVDLGRKLSSFIEFRQPCETEHGDHSDHIIVDRLGYAQRPTPDSVDASYCLYAPLESRRYMERFEQLWAIAAPSPELKDLHL